MTDQQQQQQQDLDAFLTSVESKLRGPFSSVEFTKAVTTPALRGGGSATAYLQRILQVVGRSDQAIQMRILLGLLGLSASDDDDANNKTGDQMDVEEESSPSLDQIRLELVKQAQTSPTYPEWVRVVAGLVQGVLTEEWGDEARQRLQGTAKEILDKVRALEAETNQIHQRSIASDLEEDQDPPSRLTLADLDPLMAPYRYALLSDKSLLKKVAPESQQQHAHFQVESSADILLLDAKEEAVKAQEEQEHAKKMMKKSTSPITTPNDTEKQPAPKREAILPGQQRSKQAATAAGKRGGANAGKSSLFITTKKPSAVQKPNLLARKKGAQALMANNKGKRNRLLAQRAAGGGATGPGAASTSTKTPVSTGTGKMAMLKNRTGAGTVRGRMAAARMKGGAAGKASKMKMLDVEDSKVQELAQAKKETDGKKGKVSGKKRSAKGQDSTSAKGSKLLKTAATTKTAASETSAPATQKPETTTPATGDKSKTESTALASAALSAYQAQVAAASSTSAGTATKATPASEVATQPPQQQPPPVPTPSQPRQQDWRQMLESKSNKLSAEDRFRIEQFFVERYNPTPDADTYKMKLHEERKTTPQGEPVKETYYLELDYRNFTSKQSKKVKRY